MNPASILPEPANNHHIELTIERRIAPLRVIKLVKNIGGKIIISEAV